MTVPLLWLPSPSLNVTLLPCAGVVGDGVCAVSLAWELLLACSQPTPRQASDPLDPIQSTTMYSRRSSVRTYKFGEEGASEGSEVFEFRPGVVQEAPQAMGVFGARKAAPHVMGRVPECSSEPGDEEDGESSAATIPPQSPTHAQIQVQRVCK